MQYLSFARTFGRSVRCPPLYLFPALGVVPFFILKITRQCCSSACLGPCSSVPPTQLYSFRELRDVVDICPRHFFFVHFIRRAFIGRHGAQILRVNDSILLVFSTHPGPHPLLRVAHSLTPDPSRFVTVPRISSITSSTSLFTLVTLCRYSLWDETRFAVIGTGRMVEFI